MNKGIFSCIKERLEYSNLSDKEKANLIKSELNLSHGKGKRKKKKGRKRK